MSKAYKPYSDNNRYILQHITTGDYVTRANDIGKKKAELTFTNVKEEATKFTATEANAIIGATASDNGIDNEKGFQLFETLKAIQV